MTSAEICAWHEHQDALGHRDAMGGRWTEWELAVRNTDGTCARDHHGRQIFESQAAFRDREKAALFTPISLVGQTMDLFA